jgi:hypothetical protein
LEAALIKSKTYAVKFHAKRRKNDVNFMAKVKAAKIEAKLGRELEPGGEQKSPVG